MVHSVDSSTTVVPIAGASLSSTQAQATPLNGLQREIPVNQMAPDPDQPRQTFDPDTLRALAESIASVGMINRITVRRVPTHSPISGDVVPWRIVSGERRWRASQLLGKITVGVEVLAVSDKEAAALSLIENTCREDLNLLEKAKGIRRLQAEYGYTQTEIAPMIQVGDRTRVSKLVAVLDLPDILHLPMADGSLTAAHAEVLLRLSAKEAATWGLQSIAAGWSVRRLSHMIEAASAQKSRAARGAAGRQEDANLQRLQQRLSEHLCTQVKINANKHGQRGDVLIHYDTLEILQGILERIGYTED